MGQLSKVDQRVLRSIYKALRAEVVLHGYIPDEDNFTNTQVAEYNQARENIINTMGFCIDLFSQSSDRYKGLKNQPRIVLLLSRAYNGELGLSPQYVSNGGRVDKVLGDNLTANMIIAVHLISVTSFQHTVLNSIFSNVLGQRKYIKYYDEQPGERPFFIYNSNFSDLDDPINNIMEKVYFQTVPDANMAAIEPIQPSLARLKEIDVEISENGNELGNLTIE